jgi:hypothetical protein
MTAWLGPLLKLLNELLAWFKRAKKEKSDAQRQKSRDHLHADPAGWFADHFSGLPDNQVPGDADKTAETDDPGPTPS